jgi:hypothetical protein
MKYFPFLYIYGSDFININKYTKFNNITSNNWANGFLKATTINIQIKVLYK